MGSCGLLLELQSGKQVSLSLILDIEDLTRVVKALNARILR
jgi:hypothetical protein